MEKPTAADSRRKKAVSLFIGLTGSMGSGKSEVAACFQKMGLHYISLSDIVREEIKKMGRIDRSAMQDVGNRLREAGGPGILARRVIEKIRKTSVKSWIIDGIRNPAEVRELKHLPGFFLIGVKADLPIMLKRITNRSRETDRITIREMKRAIAREWGTGEPASGQQVGKCMDMADHILENNGSLSELKNSCKNIFFILEGEHDK